MPVRPSRGRVCNTTHATDSPSAVTLICSRPLGADAAQILLRDDFESEVDRAKRFAVRMLDGCLARYGSPLDVQLLDVDGVLLFACEAGGAL